jgi:DNA invertase Pin-like site-specific DNA recombinase
LEAQKEAVEQYLNGGAWTLLASYVEVESGKHDDRPQLAEALARCRLHNATLVIAKLDRLSRDAHFLLGLQKAGVRFVAADMPEANEMLVGLMAVIAQAERRMISQRTKDALAAAKRRGKQLGGLRSNLVPLTPEAIALSVKIRQDRSRSRANDLKPIIADIKTSGVTSLGGIARALMERRIPTARGGKTWTAMQVRRVIAGSGRAD